MSDRVLAAVLAAALAIAPRGAVRAEAPAPPAAETAAAAEPGGGAQPPTAVAPEAPAAEPASEIPPPSEPAAPPPAEPARPVDPELEAAQIAWRYFERNYHPATGLVNSVEGYPNTTMWDLGSTVLATLAARDLGLVERSTFDARIDTLLWTLAMQPLFQGELPNKTYDAATGRMADYANKPTATGIGFSAIDLARLASALTILAERAPEHRAGVARVLARWRYCRLLGDGELHGAIVDAGGKVQVVQEGRLGYEQYAAESFARLGFAVSRARDYDRFAADTPILGVPVRHDTRDRRRFGAVNALVTDPWVLGAFELGRGGERGELLRRIFEVQRRRWEQTGVPTAASEDHVDEAPWFVYGAIWADGGPWQALTPDGGDAGRFRALSTKAAFALAALFPEDPYSRVLRQAVAQARDPARGWYAGIYERGGMNRSLNANTNGVVLEAILFARAGPLHGPWPAGPRGPQARAARRGGVMVPAAFPGVAGACYPGTPEAARAEALPVSPVAQGSTAPHRARLYTHPLTLSLFTDYRGVDRAGAGAVATLWPWRASFLRFGAEGTPFSPGGNARMLWGIGWDDWRGRTFFLHLDNWGPVRPGDGLAMHGAELNLGYRGPNLCGGAFCLSPLLGGTVPFGGGPYVSARATLTVAGKWFAMGGIGWTVPRVFEGPTGTPRWRVVYGFGRWDWRPGTFYVTYYDWGPTSWSHNGVLAVGVNLAF
ncbi:MULTISPECIES: DUF3131 domain-containing protein [unclassified Anaeromyxobacter]|uniref:DUF3131 domain-containing protein n=2 Tax=Anaeromyxobacter TaxID=161492 RepID=UPI001F562CA1|nr:MULTISPECIES: DUF3131 domain-containing protein [unclassified Anaeromyxobacter]